MSKGEQLGAAALRLVGAPFRLHGRDPDFGIDCVGLVATAMRDAGLEPVIPEGYRLSNKRAESWFGCASACGWVEASGDFEAGDLLLVEPAPTRSHLLLALSQSTFIHSHAGLRRVVLTPGPLPWPVRCHWRLADLQA